jgi:hypothetical protein
MKQYDRPFVNASGETIPAFACLEIGGWVDDAGGLSVFQAVKPTKAGKLHLFNGPLAVPAGRRGWATRAHGCWALYEASGTPQLNQEFGPKEGKWTLSADGSGGYIIVGDVRGNPASQPGFPQTSSTLRVRVVERIASEVPNRIQGTVASTASESTPSFLVNNIFVLSGVDPRPEPVNPVQSIVVQNNLNKAYTNGVDKVTATQNKNDLKWYVENAPGGGGNEVYGTLRTDLTSLMDDVVINVTHFSSENPADGGGGLTCRNPVDFIRPVVIPNQTRYLFVGNAGAQVTAGLMTDGLWYLKTVQSPIKPPVAPE